MRAIVKSIPAVGFDYRDDVPDAALGSRQVRIEAWDRLAALVSSGRLDLESLITHRLPLADFGDALRLLEADAAKVLLLPRM